MQDINLFIHDQLSAWEEARLRYEALKDVRIRELIVEGIPYRVQFNPARIVSSAAKVDAKSLSERPCFLCAKNRPKEQRAIDFEGRYDILVNPFPIFARHLTIVSKWHEPQSLRREAGRQDRQQSGSRLCDMMALAKALPDFTIFYNGAKCGASAPDHMHFQAVGRGELPLEQMAVKPRYARVIELKATDSCEDLLNPEPMVNLLMYYNPQDADEENTDGQDADRQGTDEQNADAQKADGQKADAQERWTLIVLERKKHRPDCYYAEGKKQLLCSPASVDLGGVFVLPREEDFEKITAKDIKQILSECCKE